MAEAAINETLGAQFPHTEVRNIDCYPRSPRARSTPPELRPDWIEVNRRFLRVAGIHGEDDGTC